MLEGHLQRLQHRRNTWGRVRFNEVNLAEIEANKPARKKITEPKTPYHPMINENGCHSPTQDYAGGHDYAAHAEAIMNALNKIAQCKTQSEHFGGWTSSEDEADAAAQNEGLVKEEDTRTFKERRRAHYDEYKRVQDLRQNGHFLDNGHGDGTGIERYNVWLETIQKYRSPSDAAD